MASVESGGLSDIPKWKFAAAALAAGGAVGLGILYYRSRSKFSKGTSSDEHSPSPDQSAPTNIPSAPTSGGPAPTESECAVAASVAGKEDAKPVSALDAATAVKEKGNKFYRGAKYDKAIECYTEAILLWPKGGTDDTMLATFYQNRAAAHEQLKNYAAVVADCTKALEYDKKYQKALARRAKAAEALEDYQTALEDATAASILDGFKNEETLMVADRVLRHLSTQKAKAYYAVREPVLPSRQTIKAYFDGFCCDPIMNCLDEYLTKEDQQQHPFLQALQEFKSGCYDNVVGLCTASLLSGDADSNFAIESNLLRGTFYILMGLGHLARSDLTFVIVSAAASKEFKATALIRRAGVSIQTFDEASAIADMASAVTLYPESPDVYYHRGLVHLLTEKIDDALKDFNKCLTLKPGFATAHVQKCCSEYRLAMVLQSFSHLQVAMKGFEDLCEAFPACSEGLISYGQVLLENRQFEQAMVMFERAAKVEPDNATVFVHRGILFQQWKNDISACERELQQALEVDDRCELAYETLGSLTIQRGDLTQGMEYFRKALPFAKSEAELAHLFALIEAAGTQLKISQAVGVPVAQEEAQENL